MEHEQAVDIVIARYAERDVAAWLPAALQALPLAAHASIYIYDKATRGADALDVDEVRRLAWPVPAHRVQVERRHNVGRAAETFLHHMATHHARYAAAAAAAAADGVPVVAAFVAGRPARGAPPTLLRQHVDAARAHASGTSVACAHRALRGQVPSRGVHAATPSFSVREWRRATVDVPVEIPCLDAWYRRRVGAPFPARCRVAWWTEGVFAVTAARLAARADPAWCAAMRADLATHDNPAAAHYLERAWAHLLAGDAAVAMRIVGA